MESEIFDTFFSTDYWSENISALLKKIVNISAFGIFDWPELIENVLDIFDEFYYDDEHRILFSGIRDSLKREYVHGCVEIGGERNVLEKISPEQVEWVFEYIDNFDFHEMHDDERIFCANIFINNSEFISAETVDAVLNSRLIQPWVISELDIFPLMKDEIYNVAAKLFRTHYPIEQLPETFAEIADRFSDHKNGKEYYKVENFCKEIKMILEKYVIQNEVSCIGY